jgi:hypothetical protein
MASFSLGEVAILLVGVALVLLPALLILVPVLWIKRLVIHLEVADDDGNPVPGVPIRGVRNRTGPALSTTGEGHLTAGQLHAVGDSLGVTDARGRFLRTYYLRNFHTLFVGSREVFVDHLRARMSETRAAHVRAGATAGDAHDPLDFSGGTQRKR